MEIIYKTLEIIKWPLVVFLIFLSVRPNIKGLIDRTIKVKTPMAELDVPREQKAPKDNFIEKSKIIEEKKERTIGFLQKQNKILTDQARELTNELFFERTYGLIFGNQIKILEWLRSVGTGGIVRDGIMAFYQKVKGVWPALQSYPFETYMRFLETSKLIEYVFVGSTKKYKITKEGLSFLAYIEKNDYSKAKSF